MQPIYMCVTRSSNVTSFSLPELEKKPIATLRRKVFIKVENVFQKMMLEKTIGTIREMKTVDGPVENNNVKRCHLSYVRGASIRFNSHSEIFDKDELSQPLEDTPDSVKELIYTGIEVMAKISGFKDMTVHITPSILIYSLDQNNREITSLPWHADGNTLTMTTLISPYKQSSGEFSGGELSSYDEWMSGINPRSDKISTCKYPENGGFIFDGIRTRHKVEDIKLIPSDKPDFKCERILFSAFASPSDDFVAKLNENILGRIGSQSI